VLLGLQLLAFLAGAVLFGGSCLFCGGPVLGGKVCKLAPVSQQWAGGCFVWLAVRPS
jgi:hypothetical protein